MWRRESHLAARIARVASSLQCSTSAAGNMPTKMTIPNIQAAENLGTFSKLFWPIVDLRHHHASRGFAAASSAEAAQHSSPSPPDLQISDNAVQRLKELQTESGAHPVFLRVQVEGGGCSGFQYEFMLDEEGPKNGDKVFSVGGATVLCDDVSLEFLKGSTVDFESDLMRSAFVVHDNPNAQSSCGCGSSFAAKID